MLKKLKKELIRMLIDGKITLDKALPLPEIASNLGCSVTPVREAMQQLRYASIVINVPNRGFMISPIDFKEIKNLYELIAILETAAIDYAEYDDLDFKNMELANYQFQLADSSYSRYEADLLFHEAMTKKYGNRLLNQQLLGLKVRTFFYEHCYMSEHKNAERSYKQHEEIINLLKKKKKPLAKKKVVQNWMNNLTTQNKTVFPSLVSAHHFQ